jgi:hypothetical protein
MILTLDKSANRTTNLANQTKQGISLDNRF